VTIPDDEVVGARRSAGLFDLADRGVLEVLGSDARRWLNGMLTNDVARLEAGAERSGCPALVLTNRGRVIADVEVLVVPGGFWLETSRAAAADLAIRLSRFVIADDVRLADRSDDLARFAVEGPAARRVVEAASGAALRLAPHACAEALVAGARVLVARFGWSGEDAVQVFAARDEGERVRAGLLAALPGVGGRACSAQALEALRIEAGRPRLGAELSEEVLPPEARLEDSISYTKGCYTGQEIVARLRSRGHVNHLLVGLRFAGDTPPPPGTALRAGDKKVGEITSAVRSPHAGAIALAYVRVGYDAAGTELDADGALARVAALPFVAPHEAVA